MDGLRIELGDVARIGGLCGSATVAVLMVNEADLGWGLARSPRLLHSSFFEEVRSVLLEPRIVCFGVVESNRRWNHVDLAPEIVLVHFRDKFAAKRVIPCQDLGPPEFIVLC